MKLFRYISVLIIYSLAITIGIATPVAAATTSTSNNAADCGTTILSGLWQGANLTFSGSGGCTSASTTSETNNTGLYIALGDSVAAGQGLSTSGEGDPACDLSSAAYPSLVSASVGVPLQNIACSGATAGDLVSEQHLSNTNRDIEPQLDQAFAAGTPQLITITAGANDLYWQYYAQKCYTDTCGTQADQAVVASLRAALAIKMRYALQSIQERSSSNPPRVVLTGYYQPLSSRCSAQLSGVTRTEISWFNRQLSRLNQTIRSAAGDYDFARYAAVSFSGHELCTSDPWVQGIDGLAPLHPTEAGQQAIAKSVIRQLR